MKSSNEDNQNDSESLIVKSIPPKKETPVTSSSFSLLLYLSLSLTILFIFFFFIINSILLPKKNNILFRTDKIINQPSSDYRKIRFVALKNGLEALLISDPLTSISSASLSVGAGSNQDPVDAPGLAHFCEHMLFLGSKTYPQGDDYFKSVSENNGHFNAFTDREITNYFFDVHYFSFDKSLDIFSHFFIDPLFSKEKVYKEINSVNSEYEKNLIVDSRKRSQIYSYLSKKDHEYNRFTTGNYETLIKNETDDILNKLKHFHKKNYVSEKMKLVIYSNDELDDLEYLVDTKFSGIKPSKNFTSHNLTSIENFTKRYFNLNYNPPLATKNVLVIFDTVVSDADELKISFVQPPIIDETNYNINPFLYYKFILESKEANSLSNILNNKGYITKLTINNEKNFKNWSDLTISLSLTKKGYLNLKTVIKIIQFFFTYCKEHLIKKEYYEYMSSLSKINFEYQNVQPDKKYQYVSKIATKMQKFPIINILNDFHIISGWNNNTAQAIKRYGEKLNMKNSIMFLNRRSDYETFNITSMSKKVKDDYEPWYKTHFTLYKNKIDFTSISKELSNELQNAFGNFTPSINKTKIKTLLNDVKKYKKNLLDIILESIKKPPTLIKNAHHFQIWTKNITTTQNNKLKIGIKLLYNITNTNDVLYLQMLEFYLKKKTKKIKNNLKLFSNSLDIYTNSFGINLDYLVNTEDFAQISSELMNKIIAIFSKQFKFKNYSLFIKEFLQKYTKYEKSQPYVLSFENIQKNFLNQSFLTTDETISLIKNNSTSSEKNFTDFLRQFRNNFQTKIIVVGSLDNLTNPEIDKLFSSLFFESSNISLIKSKKTLPKDNFVNGNFLTRTVYKKETNQNNVLTKCYYVNKVNYKDEIMLGLLSGVIGNLIFRELRINKQFGYIAKNKIKNFHNYYVNYIFIIFLVLLLVCSRIYKASRGDRFICYRSSYYKNKRKN